MSDRNSDKGALAVALVYVALAFGLWVVYVSIFYPLVENTRSVPLRILLGQSIRAGVFVAPILLHLKFVARQDPLRYLRLDAAGAWRGVRWGAAFGVAYAALVLARAWLFVPGGVNPKAVPVGAWFTALTITPLIEEVAFRGFLLQKFERVTSFWAADVLAATLFVAIHFPGWLILGGGAPMSGRVMAMAEIMFLGLLLGYVFERSKSLWASVILHATNNLLAAVFFS